MRHGSASSTGGFSLIEFCVATAVYSVGLAGFSLLIMLAMQTTANAENRGWAAMHLSSIAELMVMNAGNTGHRVFPDGASVQNWHEEIGKQLPGVGSALCHDSTPDDGEAADPACDGSGREVLKVFWSTPGGPDDERTPGRMTSHLPY
jgi:hypothetical protein